MNLSSDQQLLRDYVGTQSELAFAELVERHIDFTYSAALRMVRDAQLAEDVTQSAFLALAQNAKRLINRPVLSGWLHRTVRNLAVKTIRTDVRRRAREQEAAAMNELLDSESEAEWEQVAPHLDAALEDLSESDRDALLLRFFERKSACEIARTLGITDEAAQRRVTRAVTRLRGFLTKRGVTVGASGLIIALSTNAVHAAPIGMAVAITTTTSCGVTASATSTLTQVILFMTTTQQKLAMALAVALLLLVGGSVLFLPSGSRTAPRPAVLRTQQPNDGFELRWVATEEEFNLPADVLPNATATANPREFRVLKEAVLEGKDVTSARLSNSEVERKEFLINLTDEGARKLAQTTSGNIGRQLAIVWKGRVINAPRIRSPISGPSINITGQFGDTEAQTLLDVLNNRE